MSDSSVSWSVNGETVTLDLLDVNGVEWRDMRAATGLRQVDLTAAALIAKDMEAIAALLWVAMRRANPALAYDDVLASLSLRCLSVPD